jgi:hypothetical protein
MREQSEAKGDKGLLERRKVTYVGLELKSVPKT